MESRDSCSWKAERPMGAPGNAKMRSRLDETKFLPFRALLQNLGRAFAQKDEAFSACMVLAVRNP